MTQKDFLRSPAFRPTGGATEHPLPGLTEETVRALEALYPPKCKRPGEDNEAYMMYAGKAELAQWARTVLKTHGPSPDSIEAILKEIDN